MSWGKGVLCLASNHDDPEGQPVSLEPPMPQVPIFTSNYSQMSVYYAHLYVKEGKEKYRFWPKKDGDDEVIPPTKLDFYDENVEKMIPRNDYGGSGRKYENYGQQFQKLGKYFYRIPLQWKNMARFQ